ncbi:hypothetical protein OPT61_g4354 [Boeremia exigua]|uniref:Uncharacterized protein n=1 Tax=Boeremia exigua TaxID=749465 RepID=A0ACC2IEE1_9PLEO|nr:hypothetical protein OPT61_g4354 [Boeremia exigua]
MFELRPQNRLVPTSRSELANAPQVALSFCYLSLNSFCTAIRGIQEWSSLAVAKKGLRVSDPKGDQRSTYFLNIPYKWAIPLLVISNLVRNDTFDNSGRLDLKSSNTAVGASGVSFIAFFVVFFILWISVRILASKKITTSIPVASSSSLIISAA